MVLGVPRHRAPPTPLALAAAVQVTHWQQVLELLRALQSNDSDDDSLPPPSGLSHNQTHHEEELDEPICVVCREALNTMTTATLPCGHVVHSKCLLLNIYIKEFARSTRAKAVQCMHCRAEVNSWLDHSPNDTSSEHVQIPFSNPTVWTRRSLEFRMTVALARVQFAMTRLEHLHESFPELPQDLRDALEIENANNSRNDRERTRPEPCSNASASSRQSR